MADEKKKIEEYRARKSERLKRRGFIVDTNEHFDSVDAFRQRRNKRLLERNFKKVSKSIDNSLEMWYNKHGREERSDAGDAIDGENVDWITLKNGKHVALNGEGEIKAGPKALKGKTIGEVKKQAKENSQKKQKSGGGSTSSGAGRQENAKAASGSGKSYEVGKPLVRSQIKTHSADASDCKVEQIPNSAKKHLDKNGNFTRERQEVHRNIIQGMLDGKVPQPDGSRVVTILGGGPASGKSALRKMAESELPENSSVGIDPDEMKAALPGFEDLATRSTKAAGIYHEESSALAKSLYQTVLDSGLNAVYDGTGDGSEKSLRKKIDQAHAAGCKAVGSYMTLDIDEALKRNRARYEHALENYNAGKSKIPPRLVADDVVRAIHGAVTDTSVRCAKYFDDFKLYDNSGPKGSKPVLIATGGNGKPITAIDRDKLQAYLDKSTNRDKYFINENGEVEVKE